MPFVPPAGVTPISAFFTDVPAATLEQPPVILADAIDPTTGDYLSIERGFDPTDAAFLTSMRTVRGSGSAVEDVGQRFGDATHVTEDLSAFVREEARLATKRQVDAGDLELGNVTATDLGQGAVEAYAEWENLAAQKQRKIALPGQLFIGGAS